MIVMFIAGFFAVIGVIFMVIAFAVKDKDSKKGWGIVTAIVCGLAFLIFMFNWWTIIEPGRGGVVVLFGEVDKTPLKSGFHPVNPFCDIHDMSVRTQEYTMSTVVGEGEMSERDDAIVALSADGVMLKMDVTIPYRANLHALPWIYENFGENYQSLIIRAPGRTGLREATKEFISKEAYALKRDMLSVRVSDLHRLKVDSILSTYSDAPPNAFIFPPAMLRNIELPPKVTAAIVNKIEMEQEAQRMDFVLEKERKEATRKEIEANGIKIFQDIVTQGITPSLLKWKGIEATRELAESDNAKIVIIGNDAGEMPIILSGGDGN
jgi:regulator of protease activity HflC (stomatin/prohibitin superfamily)